MVSRSIHRRPARPTLSPRGREAQPARRPAHSETPTRPRVIAREKTPRRGPRVIIVSVPTAITPSRSVKHNSVVGKRPAIAWQITHVHDVRSRVVDVNVFR